MEALLQKIQSDSALMLLVGVAIVVLLIIVLVVVVFSSRSKTLADKLYDLKQIDGEKDEKITSLERELQLYQVRDASQKQELQQFQEIKEALKQLQETKDELENRHNRLEKSMSETTVKLENSEERYSTLLEEHKAVVVQNEKLREENSKYHTNNARLLTKLESETRHANNQMELMKTHKQELKNEFEALARKVFEGNSQKFAEFSKENMDNMIRPLQAQIAEFKKQVSDTYNAESQDRAVLKNEIHSLKELNQKISQDAINLTKALKGESKKQGIWGEMVLEHVLEASGLRKGHEFEREVSLSTEEGDVLRPDVIVHLPDDRDIIIDAKTSLVAYERYVNAHDEVKKASYLKSHLDSIKSHVNLLAAKNYERLKEVQTLDFIFMFMPIEGALAVALEHESSIYDEAFRKKILLVGPTTLLVAMRAVENVWKHERQNQNAKEIARRAGAMYDKFVGFSEDLVKISKQIDTVQNSFTAARSKLSDGRGNLVRQVEQLKELGAQTSKKIPREIHKDAK